MLYVVYRVVALYSYTTLKKPLKAIAELRIQSFYDILLLGQIIVSILHDGVDRVASRGRMHT
jgi:predicted sulfurtransferase